MMMFPHSMYIRRLFATSSSTLSISQHPSRSSTIGFIGLGAMGKEMASNLLTKSFPPSHTTTSNPTKGSFVIHDNSEQAMIEFFDRHAHLYPSGTLITASTPASVARQASTILTMLPASVAVEEVYLNPETGLLSGLHESLSSSSSSLCIDCTTLDRKHAIEVAQKISNTPQVAMLDAPVSGGVTGAREGTLSFMCGGDRASFESAESYLVRMGKRTIYCGPSGSGLAAKIANNLLLAISMIGTAEAMLLGSKLGLAPEVLSQIINSSSGRCWSSEVNNPAPGALLKSIGKSTPADSNYKGGFKSRLMLKDLSLATSAADQSSLRLPMATLSSRIYEKIGNDPEFEDLDFSVIYRWLEVANQGLQSDSEDSKTKQT